MTSALIHVNALKAALPLRADLESAGIQVLGIATERAKLLQEVVRHAPDVLICDEPAPDDALFRATLSIALTAPCPVIVFTSDADAVCIARAIESDIHAYVVQGYGANREGPVVRPQREAAGRPRPKPRHGNHREGRDAGGPCTRRQGELSA